MTASEISQHSVAEAIASLLSGAADEKAVAAILNFEVKDLQLLPEPAEASLPAEPLRCTHRYWTALPKTDGVGNGSRIDPFTLRSALGYLMLIDVEPADGAYRYALYGTKIAAVSGFDMTGKTVGEVATTSPVRIFFAACYDAVRARPCALYTIHKAPPHITASHWHRLILPLGDAGVVKRFLVCNTPIRHGQLM